MEDKKMVRPIWKLGMLGNANDQSSDGLLFESCAKIF